ncbi:MAG: hypothetical protein ACLQO7_11455 [Candidatus Bathyarchaeia archaeon]
MPVWESQKLWILKSLIAKRNYYYGFVGGPSGIYRKSFACGISIAALILTLMWVCPNTSAQTNSVFGPATKFRVPAYNGVISFATNGSYMSATFADNTWTFKNLRLNGSQPLDNLEISTENSSVTINSYQTVTFGFPSEFLNISVQGKGQQVINMGVGAFSGTNVDWVVASNVTFLNSGWSVSHNGTVSLTGLTGNLNIIYFNFTSQIGSSNLPFYKAHSVAIAVTIGVIATFGAAVVVRVAVRKRTGTVRGGQA